MKLPVYHENGILYKIHNHDLKIEIIVFVVEKV